MEMTTKSKIGLALLLALFFGLTGYAGYRSQVEPVVGAATNTIIKVYGDFVGTRTGTSTTGVAFSVKNGGISASTSYYKKIGNGKDFATLIFKATMASTSASLVQADVFGSLDSFCDATATSTTDVACVGDCFLTTDVNWFSAGDHFKQTSHLVDVLNDSSSAFVKWVNPVTTTPGVEISLDKINYECLRLDVAASSTELYVGIGTK